MEEQTNKANSGALELEPSEGGVNVPTTESSGATPSEEAAEYYQKLTGREDIKSREDFEKHYEGMKSLVGDQKLAELRQKAEKYEALQAEIKKEADEFGKTPAGKEVAKDFAREAVEDRLSNLEDEIKTSRFLKNHPEAEPIADLIKAKALRNEVPLEDAYGKTFNEKYSLQDLLATKLEVEKTKAEEKSIGVESKARTGSMSSQELAQLTEQVQKTDTLAAKQKLVEKVLGLSER